MKRKIIAIVILGMFLLASLTALSTAGIVTSATSEITAAEKNTNGILAKGDYTLHDPIKILSDKDFNAANGVTSGSGTQADPYIIEGWEIDLSGKDSSGIQIVSSLLSPVTKYFVIRNCYIHDGQEKGQDGIALNLLKKAQGSIENCITERNKKGIDIYGNGIQIKNCVSNYNDFGILVEPDGKNIVIDHCDLSNNIFDGILIYCRSTVTVTNCNISDNLNGIDTIGVGGIIPIILKANNNNFKSNNDYCLLINKKTFGNAKDNYWSDSKGPSGKVFPSYGLFLVWSFPYLTEPNPNAGPQ